MSRQTWWLLLVLSGCQCGGPTGGDDAGPQDSGLTDAGREDAGVGDAGQLDAGPLDASIDLGACANVTWEPPLPCAASTLQGRMSCVPGMSFQHLAPLGGRERYTLWLPQRVDHADVASPTFMQQAMLLLGDPGAPTVLSTTGYQLWPYLDELTQVFGANQLTYEHRYFGATRPSTTDWSPLTIEQAAADAHGWVEALRWVLPGRWVNTGASKGGMTSVYHRRFYPCDVEGTVAYVAPVSYGTRDDGYGTFLAQVGGAAYAGCRAELTALQRRLLTARSQLEPLLGGTYNRVGGVDIAFELAVVELPFAFWQYTSPDDPSWGCAAIPPAGASDAEMLDFLQYHSQVAELAGDASLATWEPYYYQASTQLGAPAPYEAGIADLLLYPGADVAETYAPLGVPLVFDANSMPDVNQWIDQQGERLMLVYGEFDPWSTHQLPLGAAKDSFVYVVPGGNHFSRLGLLPPAEKEAAVSTLERWMGRQRAFTPQALHAPAPLHRVPR